MNRPTTTKTRIVARSQQVVRVDEEDDSDHAGADAERVLAAVEAAVARADALVLEDYNKGVLVPRVIEAAMRTAARRAAFRSSSIRSTRTFSAFAAQRSSSRTDASSSAALGADVDLEHPEALPTTFSRLGVEHLLLTLGEHGMVLISSGGVVKRVPTAARAVYDVVGAGDTVTAYLALMLAAGGSPSEAAVIANFAAGVEVEKAGAATVSANEVVEAYDHYRNNLTNTEGRGDRL